MSEIHICEPMRDHCRCSMIADEPSERCAIHGAAAFDPPRCRCGKFVSHPKVTITYDEPVAADPEPVTGERV